MIDDVDRQILTILQDNARTPAAEIARRVEMAPSAVFERIKKLEERGVIRGYTANLDPKPLELDLLAFILVRADERIADIEAGRQIGAIPGVQEVHHIAGEDCYLVKVRTRDTESLGRLLRERFGSIPFVRGTRTTIVLETVKESAQLPIHTQAGNAAAAGSGGA
jgi:Lrp/AsnC family transcriptional regulator, leucine-responsive regulatory protein